MAPANVKQESWCCIFRFTFKIYIFKNADACHFNSNQKQSTTNPALSAIIPGGGKGFSRIVYFKVISSAAMEKRK